MATLTDYDLRINTRNADKELANLYNYYNNQFSRKGLNLQINTGAGGIAGANKELTTFNRNLDVSTSRIVSFAATSSLIFGLVNAFQTLVRDFINVEKSLASIQAITGVSNARLSQLSDTIFNLANSTGQSFDQASSAFEEFARQGLSATRSIEATSAALTLSRIGATDAATAVKDLTAIMNTFVGSGMDYVDVVDQIIALDNSFAVSAQGISEGLRRVSGVASEAGISFSETASLITALQQISARGESVIGNSLKSIFTRVQRPEVLSQLEELGIQTKNTDGSFRNLITILTDLSVVYKTLSDSQRAAIGETVAGVYQINAFQTAMKALNPEASTFAKAMKVAGDASGNAASRLEVLNNTTSTSLTILQNNLKQFNSTIGNLTIKPVIDDFTSGINRLLQNFNTLIKADDFQNTGKRVAEGFLKGLGSVISGPGIAALGIILGKLFARVGKDLLTAFQSFTSLNQSAQNQVQLQQAINVELAKGNREIATRLAMMQKIASTPLSGSLLGGGGRVRNRAKGLLPAIDREKRAISMGVGGAPSNAKPVVTALKKGGFSELAVVNSSEQIVRKNGKDFVLTKDMQIGNFAVGSVAEEELKLMNLQYRLQEAERKKISKKIRRQIAIEIGKQEKNLERSIKNEGNRISSLSGRNQSSVFSDLERNISNPQQSRKLTGFGQSANIPSSTSSQAKSILNADLSARKRIDATIVKALSEDSDYKKLADQIRRRQKEIAEISPIDMIADPIKKNTFKNIYGLTNAELGMAKNRQLRAMKENKISPIDMISQSPRIVDYKKFGPTSADLMTPNKESREELIRRMSRAGISADDLRPEPKSLSNRIGGAFKASTRSLSGGRFGGAALGAGLITPLITDMVLGAAGQAETEIGKKISSGASAVGSGLTVAGALGFSPLGIALGTATTAVTLWKNSVSDSVGALEGVITKARDGAASLNTVSESATELSRLIQETEELRRTGGPLANINRNENQIRQLSSELPRDVINLLNNPKLNSEQRAQALAGVSSGINRNQQALGFSANVAKSALEWTEEAGFSLKSLENAASNFVGSMADDVKLSNASIASLRAGKFGEFLKGAQGDMAITEEMAASMWNDIKKSVEGLNLPFEQQRAAMSLMERGLAAATYSENQRKEALEAAAKSARKTELRTNQLKRTFDSFASSMNQVSQIRNLERSISARNANEVFQQAVRLEPNLSPVRQAHFESQTRRNEINQRYNQEVRSLLEKELPEISKSLIEGARTPEQMAKVANQIANYFDKGDVAGLESLLKANNADNDATNAVLRRMESAQVKLSFEMKKLDTVRQGELGLNNQLARSVITAAIQEASGGVFSLRGSLDGDNKEDADLIKRNEQLIQVRRKELEQINKSSKFIEANSEKGRQVALKRQAIQEEIDRATIESISARARLFNLPQREDAVASELRGKYTLPFIEASERIRGGDVRMFGAQEASSEMESIRERSKNLTGNAGTVIGEELMKKITRAISAGDFGKAASLFQTVESRPFSDEKINESIKKISEIFRTLESNIDRVNESVGRDAKTVLGGVSRETEDASAKALKESNDALVQALTESSSSIYKAFTDNIPTFQREIEAFGKDSEYLGRFLQQFSESANLLANSGVKTQVENTVNVNVDVEGALSSEEFKAAIDRAVNSILKQEFPKLYNGMRKQNGEKPVNMPPTSTIPLGF